LGLRLAKSTENLTHDGYDNLLQDKSYHFKVTVHYAIEDEVVAFKLK